jgi:hypothetical protein
MNSVNWGDLAAMSAVIAAILTGLVYIIKKETAPLADRIEKLEDTNLEMLAIVKALALSLKPIKGVRSGGSKKARN